MNNKEKRLREMCERKRKFCDLSIPKVFRLLYFDPTRPIPPINNTIVYPFN